MRKKSLAAIIKEAAEQETIEGKIFFLRSNKSSQLVDVFNYMFDPRVKFLLPHGKTPYKKITGLLDQEGRLYVEMKHISKFCAFNGVPAKPLPGKTEKQADTMRQNWFLQMLESIDPEDAKLMVAIKDKKMPHKGLTKKIVHEAFPEIYIGESEVTQEVEVSEDTAPMEI
jgi:hypothetical protein